MQKVFWGQTQSDPHKNYPFWPITWPIHFVTSRIIPRKSFSLFLKVPSYCLGFPAIIIARYRLISFGLLQIKLDVPASSAALQYLIGASSQSLDHGWEVGWSLASYNDTHRPYLDITQKEVFNKHSTNL